MSYNGSGTFQINTSGQPVVTGTSISSTVFNALTADLATGLSTAITKDGQTTTTARIPFALGINSTLVTDATNTTSGSIITAGGVGIAKALFVGTTANVAGAVTLGGVATFSAQPIFSSLTASSAVATDASKGLVSVTNTGTGNNVLATAPTIASLNLTTALTIASAAGTAGQALTSGGAGNAPTWTTVGAGDVVGPASATANGVALFNSTTGKLIKDSAASDGLIYGLTVGRGAGAVATNTAVGAYALAANTTGTTSVAVGYNAGTSAVTATENTFVGSLAGQNIVGSGNAAFGSYALNNIGGVAANGTGTYNCAFGKNALLYNTSGAYNIALGPFALQGNTTASNNVGVGYNAGNGITSGGTNTFLGYNAGSGVTSGSKNVILGAYTGVAAPISATASNYIVFSDGDGTVRGYFNNSGSGFFSGATVAYPGSGNTNTGIFLESAGQFCVSRDNTVAGRFNRNSSDGIVVSFARQGTEVGSVQITTTATSYVTSSDYRLKENIAPMTGALAKVALLKPVTYKWKLNGLDGQGFIAHELQAVVPDCVLGEKDGTQMQPYEITPAVNATYDEDGNELTPAIEAVMGEREVPKYQGIDTSFLVATLTAAIQEQQALITQLTARITALEGAA